MRCAVHGQLVRQDRGGQVVGISTDELEADAVLGEQSIGRPIPQAI